MASNSEEIRTGEPISDDSGDDGSQIQSLQEERGIFTHPEVSATPREEEEDDLHPPPPTANPEHRRQSMESDSTSYGTADFDRDLGKIREILEPLPEALGKRLEYPSGPPPDYEEAARQPSVPLASTPPVPVVAPSSSSSKTAAPNSGINKSKMAMGNRRDTSDDDDDEDYDDMDIPLDIQKKNRHGASYQFTDEEIDLLDMIDLFKPDAFKVEPFLKPFMQDYKPCIGEIDPFVKVPRPDEVEDNIGLLQLDEPSIKQSDRTIMDMQLRQAHKEAASTHEPPVKLLARADRNSTQIEKWILDIKELHRTKPPTSVHYNKPLPDIEKLMQEWPADFEKHLSLVQLPKAELDVDLPTFVDIGLSLVDIPVHKSRIQSLHLLFSLYAEFKNSQHFKNLAQNAENVAFGENTDRLEL